VNAQPEAPRFDVCVVTWRTRELLRGCLRSLSGRPEVGQVVVVDNASGDGTVEMVQANFPGVTLIANDRNLSFATGSNQALRATTSPFVLLLNPDTEVRPGALRVLLNALREDPRIGAVAPQLILPDGSVQRSVRGFPEPAAIAYEASGLARLFPRRPAVNQYRLRDWDHTTRRDVDQPMASALGLRRAALDQVGLFDEAFPLYFNDVDLCYRLRQAGWRIVFVPEAKVAHCYGQSSTWQVRPRAILDSHRSLIRFYRKHYRGRVSRSSYLTAVLLAWVTMWPRAAWAWAMARGEGR
jgi:hypothetical protein